MGLKRSDTSPLSSVTSLVLKRHVHFSKQTFCCGHFDIKVGSIVFASISIFGALFLMAVMIIFIAEGGEPELIGPATTIQVVWIIDHLLTIITSVLVIFGVWYDNRYLLLPFIIAKVINVFFLMMQIGMVTTGSLEGPGEPPTEEFILLIFAVAYCFYTLLCVYFVWIVLQTYQYMGKRARYVRKRLAEGARVRSFTHEYDDGTPSFTDTTLTDGTPGGGGHHVNNNNRQQSLEMPGGHHTNNNHRQQQSGGLLRPTSPLLVTTTTRAPSPRPTVSSTVPSSTEVVWFDPPYRSSHRRQTASLPPPTPTANGTMAHGGVTPPLPTSVLRHGPQVGSQGVYTNSGHSQHQSQSSPTQPSSSPTQSQTSSGVRVNARAVSTDV